MHVQSCSAAVLQRHMCTSMRCVNPLQQPVSPPQRHQRHVPPQHGAIHPVGRRPCRRQAQWRQGINRQLTRAGDADDLPAAQRPLQALEGAADHSGNGAGPAASELARAAEHADSSSDAGLRTGSDCASGSTASSADVQQGQTPQHRSQRQQLQRDVLAGCKRLWRSQTSSWRRLRKVGRLQTCS